MNAKREREAHTAVATHLREAHPDARWDAIADLGRALACEIYSGPYGADYWRDVDPLCIEYPGWTEGCRMLSRLIEALPVEVWYDFDSGCVTETDPYLWQGNWEDGAYMGPDDLMTVPTIEALFDRELWRYLT